MWCLVQAAEKSGSLSHSFRSHSAPRSTALSIAMFGEVVEMADSLINNLIKFWCPLNKGAGRKMEAKGAWAHSIFLLNENACL